MHKTSYLRMTELNPQLSCPLCHGYLIDATNVTECRHTFCKSCIVKYLQSRNSCPVCATLIHKTKPLMNIRPDKTLQNLVYKLVPGLFKNEMKRRKDFYATHPHQGEAGSLSDKEDRGEVDDERLNPPEDAIEEHVSLCIRLADKMPPFVDSDNEKCNDRRYLKCPAEFPIGLLKKFIALKFDLPQTHKVEVFHSDENLKDDYTLGDIAYVYGWRRIAPLNLYYVVYDTTQTHIILPPSSPNVAIFAPIRKRGRPGKRKALEESKQKEEWQSMNGIGKQAKLDMKSSSTFCNMDTCNSESASETESNEDCNANRKSYSVVDKIDNVCDKDPVIDSFTIDKSHGDNTYAIGSDAQSKKPKLTVRLIKTANKTSTPLYQTTKSKRDMLDSSKTGPKPLDWDESIVSTDSKTPGHSKSTYSRLVEEMTPLRKMKSSPEHDDSDVFSDTNSDMKGNSRLASDSIFIDTSFRAEGVNFSSSSEASSGYRSRLSVDSDATRAASSLGSPLASPASVSSNKEEQTVPSLKDTYKKQPSQKAVSPSQNSISPVPESLYYKSVDSNKDLDVSTGFEDIVNSVDSGHNSLNDSSLSQNSDKVSDCGTDSGTDDSFSSNSPSLSPENCKVSYRCSVLDTGDSAVPKVNIQKSFISTSTSGASDNKQERIPPITIKIKPVKPMSVKCKGTFIPSIPKAKISKRRLSQLSDGESKKDSDREMDSSSSDIKSSDVKNLIRKMLQESKSDSMDSKSSSSKTDKTVKDKQLCSSSSENTISVTAVPPTNINLKTVSSSIDKTENKQRIPNHSVVSTPSPSSSVSKTNISTPESTTQTHRVSTSKSSHSKSTNSLDKVISNLKTVAKAVSPIFNQTVAAASDSKSWSGYSSTNSVVSVASNHKSETITSISTMSRSSDVHESAAKKSLDFSTASIMKSSIPKTATSKLSQSVSVGLDLTKPSKCASPPQIATTATSKAKPGLIPIIPQQASKHFAISSSMPKPTIPVSQANINQSQINNERVSQSTSTSSFRAPVKMPPLIPISEMTPTYITQSSVSPSQYSPIMTGLPKDPLTAMSNMKPRTTLQSTAKSDADEIRIFSQFNVSPHKDLVKEMHLAVNVATKDIISAMKNTGSMPKDLKSGSDKPSTSSSSASPAFSSSGDQNLLSPRLDVFTPPNGIASSVTPPPSEARLKLNTIPVSDYVPVTVVPPQVSPSTSQKSSTPTSSLPSPTSKAHGYFVKSQPDAKSGLPKPQSTSKGKITKPRPKSPFKKPLKVKQAPYPTMGAMYAAATSSMSGMPPSLAKTFSSMPYHPGMYPMSYLNPGMYNPRFPASGLSKRSSPIAMTSPTSPMYYRSHIYDFKDEQSQLQKLAQMRAPAAVSDNSEQPLDFTMKRKAEMDNSDESGSSKRTVLKVPSISKPNH